MTVCEPAEDDGGGTPGGGGGNECVNGFKKSPGGALIPCELETKPRNPNGSCPEGYQDVSDKEGDAGLCGRMPPMGSERERDGGGGGEGGSRGGGGGVYVPGGGGGGGMTCYSGAGIEGTICVPSGGGVTKRGAAGGAVGDLGRYMKKSKKHKKYQTGGIASLTRSPAMGAAVNPADGYNFGFAQGGLPAMPEYKAGGRLLRGEGDGMSDDIPAVIRGKGVQRAALADGEFVIPADVVSHLGNGSTEAGAKKLYQMMARIRKARTGKSKQAPAVKVDKYLPR